MAADTDLLTLFRQCAHRQYHMSAFPGQGRILLLLDAQGDLTQKELAEITQRRSATLSEQLDTLEASGLIERTRCDEDKRNVRVRITRAGRGAASEAKIEREAIAEAMFGALSATEKAALGVILEKMLKSLSEADRA